MIDLNDTEQNTDQNCRKKNREKQSDDLKIFEPKPQPVKLRQKNYYNNCPELEFFTEKNYTFRVDDLGSHDWIFENFPMDCKMSSAWIDWAKVERCKRWFPYENEADAAVKLRDIISAFQLGNPQVFFDACKDTITQTRLSHIAEYFDDISQRLPGFDTYIWNPEDKWVIEVPVSNYDQPYSINFGYSDRNWKERNKDHFANVRGK